MASLLNRREELRALRLARTQPQSAGEFQEFLEELTERGVEMVLADDRVQARLDGVRHAVVATDYREDKPAADGGEVLRSGEVCIYDYDKDVLVVAVVNLRQGTVVDLFERHGVQPPITAEEVNTAKTIASRDSQMASLLSRAGRNIVAFPTPAYLETHARARHRCATLYLSPEQAHHEVAQVTVDLSAQQVVRQEELTAGSPRIAFASDQHR
jgi:hypothetical protein